MGSWKGGEIGHQRVAGDIVELRDNAERGVHTLFRVHSVDGNGDVHLSLVRQGPAPAGDAIRIASDDVGEAVFLARAEVLAAHAHDTGLAERI